MSGRRQTLRRRLPRVHVEVGPALPGWVLRVTAALLPTLLVVGAFVRTPAMASPRSTPFVAVGLAAAAALALSTLRWPGVWQPILAVLASVVMVILTPDDRWWVLVLAPLGYLGLRTAVLAAAVPWTARVEWGVLARAARTDLLVVAVTFVIGCLGLVLDGDQPAGLVLGSLAVLGLAWWVRRP